MAGRDNLRTLFLGRLGQQAEDLTLTENFQMRIRFVQQQDRFGVGVEMGEQQKGLLKSPAGGGQIKPASVDIPVFKADFSDFLFEIRLKQLHAEQAAKLRCNQFPRGWILRKDLVAEVAQHLRGLSLTDQKTDLSRLFEEFAVGQAGHGRKVGDFGSDGGLGHFRELGLAKRRLFKARFARRPAEKGLRVLIVKLQAAAP